MKSWVVFLAFSCSLAFSFCPVPRLSRDRACGVGKASSFCAGPLLSPAGGDSWERHLSLFSTPSDLGYSSRDTSMSVAEVGDSIETAEEALEPVERVSFFDKVHSSSLTLKARGEWV